MALSNYDPGQELSSINFGGMLGGPLSAVVDAQAAAALSTVNFIKSVGFTPDIVDEESGVIVEPGKPVYVSFKYPKMIAPYTPATTASVVLNTGGTGYAVNDKLSIVGTNKEVTVVAVDTDGLITKITTDTTNITSPAYVVGNGIVLTGGTGTSATVDVQSVNQEAQMAVFQDMILEVPILTMMPIPYIRVDYLEVDFHAKITSMEYKETASKLNASLGLTVTNTNEINGGGGVKSKKAQLSGSVKNTNTVELKVNASYQQSVKGGHKIEKTYQLGVKMRATQDEMPAGMEKILGILEDAITAQPAPAPVPATI